MAMNWNDGVQARDWSVTVWGNAGPVTVTHEAGISSDSLPVVPPKGGPEPSPVDPDPEPEPEPVDPIPDGPIQKTKW